MVFLVNPGWFPNPVLGGLNSRWLNPGPVGIKVPKNLATFGLTKPIPTLGKPTKKVKLHSLPFLFSQKLTGNIFPKKAHSFQVNRDLLGRGWSGNGNSVSIHHSVFGCQIFQNLLL